MMKEKVEAQKPGENSSVTAPPPMISRFSRTRVLSPALDSYAAQVSPLWQIADDNCVVSRGHRPTLH